MKTYVMQRTEVGNETWVYDENRVRYILDPREDIWRFGVLNFDWGSSCGECRQLALALLADVTSDARLAIRYYKTFALRHLVPCKRPSIIWTERTLLTMLFDLIWEDLAAGRGDPRQPIDLGADEDLTGKKWEGN